VANPYQVRSLLIDGWGLIQRAKIEGPFGVEGTGLRPAWRKLGKGISAWRVGSEGQPLFRLLFLQFVFLMPKNINTYSLFYDVVSGSRFGCRSETFQYNHVTNLASRSVELDEDGWIAKLKLPDFFSKFLFEQEHRAFGVAVASGAHFRCVLTDEQVVEGLNEWLRAEVRLKELSTLRDDDHEKEGVQDRRAYNVGADPAAAADTQAWLHASQEEASKAAAELRERIELLKRNSVHNAQRAAQEVRRRLENYIHTVGFAEQVEAPFSASI